MTDPNSIWLRPESAGVGRPAEHTRAEVTAAAVAVAEAEGFAAVSMRKVAARLDTGAASLYRYVRNRDELLQLMADDVYRQLDLRRTGRGWRADLVEAGLAGFRTTVAHPWFVDLLTETPFLASGPGTARLAEHCLSLMADLPISGARKMEAIGVMGGMVQQYAAFVVRQNLAELMATQAAYLSRVAQDGGHPHLAAVFGEVPLSDGGSETPEQVLGRMLTVVFDGMFGPEPR